MRLLAAFVGLALLPVRAWAGDAVLPPPVLPLPAPPAVSAESYVLYDAQLGLELAAHNVDERLPMASTTKIMTALVVLLRTDLDDVVTVSEAAAEVGESEIGLWAGERWTVRQLVTAMAIRSANDAAIALAEHVGGSVEGFVEMMNSEAARLGLTNTSFTNPHGLDAEGHYSSARDLLTMTLVVMEDPFFSAAVRSSEARFPADPNGVARVASTTNRLLSNFEGAIGVKTGFTDQAGLVLVAAAERQGRRLYAVVMGSTGDGNHFRDAATLLDYGFNRLALIPAVASGSPLPRPAPTAEDSTVAFLVHLASAGLLTGTPPPAPKPSRVELSPPAARQLPGFAAAWDWPLRYWQWLAGDG